MRTCVCLFRFFARHIDIAQLPRGNLSKVESLSLTHYGNLYSSLSIPILTKEKKEGKKGQKLWDYFSRFPWALNENE